MIIKNALEDEGIKCFVAGVNQAAESEARRALRWESRCLLPTPTVRESLSRPMTGGEIKRQMGHSDFVFLCSFGTPPAQ